ncbi:putative lipoprotein [Staphylococcus aureus subsp. aureus IS-88]|nr:hypothetical protein [Staphylococcus aureus]EHS25220.1 putative lipoprotein [Staphylococcus aureus subsp. aureus IS-88]
MKKFIGIILMLTLVLAGCGENQSNKSEDTKDKNVSADERNKMIKELIVHGYGNDSYKDYKNKKDILSEKMLKQADTQNQSNKNDEIKKKAQDIKLYQDVDNDDEMLYSVKVSIENKKLKKLIIQLGMAK